MYDQQISKSALARWCLDIVALARRLDVFLKVMASDSEEGMVVKLVISMLTPEGEARRGKISYNFEHIVGLPGEDAPQWLASKFVGRHKGANRSATIGSFFGHVTAWNRLLKLGDNGGLVVEDDARQCRPDIMYKELPENSLTLLGGTLRTPGSWDREQAEWLASGKFLTRLGEMHPGVNKLAPNKFTMAVSYYVPPGFAKKLLDVAKNCSSIRPIDAWLQRNGMVGYIHFPNIFTDDPTAKSQCGTNKKELVADLYCCEMMRTQAQKLGFILPATGAPVSLFFKELERVGMGLTSGTSSMASSSAEI